MKRLSEVPFLLSFATSIWGDDEKVSPETCLDSLPFFMPLPCWTRLVVKGLGVAIIAGACLNKAPIILNLRRTQSAAGLAKTAFYGEVLVYANCAFYGWLEQQPFTAYGENVAMCVQSLIIVSLIWKYSHVSFQEKSLAGAVAALYVATVLAIVTPNYHSFLMASIWPLMIVGRGSQIFKTFQTGHTGAQSVVSISTSLVGSSIRIVTTIQEVGWDLPMLMGFILSLVLNSILFGQYWYYKSSTVAFVQGLEKKKEA